MIESMQRAQQSGSANATVLVRALSTVAADLQIPATYMRLVSAAAELAAAESAVFYLCEESGARMLALFEGGHAGQPDERMRIEARDTLYQRARAAEGPVLLGATGDDSRRSDQPDPRPTREAQATVYLLPLRADERLLGFLELGYRTAVALDDASLDVLRHFAAFAARHLLHALLLEEQSAQAHSAQVRATIAVAMRAPGDRNTVLQRLVDELGAELGVSRCVVQVGARLRRARHAYEAQPAQQARQIDAALQSIEAWVAERGNTLIANDIRVADALDPALLSQREALLAAHVRALLVTPIIAGVETLGTLALLETERARDWRPAEILLAEQVARDGADVLLHAHLAAEQARQADALRRERDLLRTAIDHLPLGVIIAETPDDLVLWNRHAQILSVSGGNHALEEDDQPVFEAFLPDGRPLPPDERPLVRAFRDEAAITAQEISVRQRDGRITPATVSAIPLYDAQSQLAGMLATVLDISALRQAEAQAGRYEAWFLAAQRAAQMLATQVPLAGLGAAVGKVIETIVPFDLLTIVSSEGEDTIEHLVQWPSLEAGELNPAAEKMLLDRLRDERAPLLIDDLRDAKQGEGLDEALQEGIQSCVALPLGDGEDLLGALILCSRRQHRYDKEDLVPLTAIAATLALALGTEQHVQRARDVAIREERDRLAREIHDTLAQTITGVVMQLDSVMLATPADAPHRGRLEQARQMARESMTQTRRAVWNLKPANAKQHVPRTILQDEIAVLEGRMGIHPEVTTTGEERDVAPEVGAVLQRLIRVALENTWMHSDAKQVRIVLDYGLQSLTLLIEDDGQGFDPDTVKLQGDGRAGLAGVAERARLIGGTVRIKSAVGHGTQVQAELPYLPAEPAPVIVAPIPAPSLEAAPPTGTPQPEGTGRIKVFLIDDHAMVREGLERMLQDQDDLQVVGAAANGTDGLRRIAELHPDVVLCDLQLPDMSGVDVIARIHTHFKDIRCVVVTTYADEDSIHEGFKAGAKGYVLKDVSATELANAVRAAARDESLLQPIVARKLVEGFTELARQGGIVEALTEREVEVLKALASGARNKEIAFDLGLSESTIKTHLASIFGKLNVTTRTEAVARGRDLGLISL